MGAIAVIHACSTSHVNTSANGWTLVRRHECLDVSATQATLADGSREGFLRHLEQTLSRKVQSVIAMLQVSEHMCSTRHAQTC